MSNGSIEQYGTNSPPLFLSHCSYALRQSDDKKTFESAGTRGAGTVVRAGRAAGRDDAANANASG